MPATTLDADAYPHLLESVIQHAPYQSLLALRGVSRTLKTKADVRLAEHIILRMPDLGPPTARTDEWHLYVHDPDRYRQRVRSVEVLSAVPGSSGAHTPATNNPPAKEAEVFVTSYPRGRPDPDHRVPSLMGWQDVAAPYPDPLRAHCSSKHADSRVAAECYRSRTAALRAMVAPLRGVQVVDVADRELAFLEHQVSDTAARTLEVFRDVMNPAVVRFHSPWGRRVDFARGARQVHFIPLLASSNGSRWIISLGRFPICSHLVIHFTGTQAIPHGVVPPDSHVTIPRNWSQITLIFTDVWESAGEYNSDGRWLKTTTELVTYRPCAMFTLIDAAPTLFGVEQASEIPAMIEQEIAQQLGPLIPTCVQVGKDRWVNRIAERIEVISRDEYRQRVGEETYVLDMVGLSPSTSSV